MLKVNQASLKERQSRWRHKPSSWWGRWALVLHGWAGQALTLGSVCSDMSVLQVSCQCRRWQVSLDLQQCKGIQVAPSGQVQRLLCYIPSWIWPAGHRFSLCLDWLCEDSRFIYGQWLSGLFQSVNSSVLLLSPLPFLLWPLDTDLHASAPSLSAFKTRLFRWTYTDVCYIWIRRHRLAWFALPLSFWDIYFDL